MPMRINSVVTTGWSPGGLARISKREEKSEGKKVKLKHCTCGMNLNSLDFWDLNSHALSCGMWREDG
jgi:hypothetical protein